MQFFPVAFKSKLKAIIEQGTLTEGSRLNTIDLHFNALTVFTLVFLKSWDLHYNTLYGRICCRITIS